MNKTFYEYELNGKKIIFHKDNIILIQIGKNKGKYKVSQSFTAGSFGQAIMNYNMLNVGNGYKKRLYCEQLNKKTLHKVLT